MRQILACAAMLSFVFLAWSAQPAQPVQPAKKQSPASGKRTSEKKTVSATKAPTKTTTRTGTSSPHKTASTPAHKTGTTTAHKTGITTRKTGTLARKEVKKGPAAPRAAAWRSRQLAPTPERYREIQDALAAKGYLKSEEADGTWGQSSMDALKRFQADQKIESTGKINSLSLIALGLGPKHESAAAKPPAPAPERP